MDERETLHSKLLIREGRNLIDLGRKHGTLHEKDLRSLFFGTSMKEEDWPEVFRALEGMGIRIIPQQEGGSLFFPGPEELADWFREDAAAVEYIRKLESSGIGRCLTPEQESELAAHRSRLIKAEELLVEGNLLRVISVARQYCGQGMIPLDLFSEGNRALTEAVKAWSRDIDCPMTLYLIHHIRKGLRTALTCMTDRPPRIRPEALEAVRRLRVETDDTPMPRLSRLPEPGENAALYLLKQQLEDNPEMVTPREREILRLRLGLADGSIHSLEETAEHFGITRERVRQIENKFLRRSRTYRKKLRDFYN